MLTKFTQDMSLWKRSLLTVVGMLGASSLFLGVVMTVVASTVPANSETQDDQVQEPSNTSARPFAGSHPRSHKARRSTANRGGKS